MVKRRLSYWKHGTGRWVWWLAVTAPLWLVGAFILIRDGLLPLRFREIYILQFFPSARVYWYWYVICALVYIIVILFFVAPAANQATIQDVKERHRESFRRYRTGIASNPAPLDDLQKTYDLIPLQSNIVHPVQGNIVDAYEGEHGEIIEGRLNDERSFRVVVATYINNPETHPKRRIIAVPGVGAEITFSFFDGITLPLRIYNAAWLSEPENRVDFDIKGKHDLVAISIENDNTIHAIRREFDGAHPKGITRRIPLHGDLFELRIRLFGTEGACLDDYKMMLIAEREPELSVTLTWAAMWKTFTLGVFWTEGSNILDALYKISSETHEKVMAPGGFDPEVKAAIDAEEKKKETEVAVFAAYWEEKTANFIGLHLSKKQRDAFLGC